MGRCDSNHKFYHNKHSRLKGIDGEIKMKRKKTDKKTVSMGSQTNTNAGILTINTQTFLSMINENNNPEQVFLKVNKILNNLIPVVLKNQGIVDHFLGGGLCALYTDSCEAALHTAIEMGPKMEEWKSYAIGIAYGSIMVGTVGNEQVFSTVTVSEYTGLSEFLQSMALEYYSQMLISGNFANQVESFYERYEYRFLGYIYIKSMNKLEKIYDVTGVNPKEVRWLKRKTKAMFEEGVWLFTKGNYEMARKHFVEVLKVNRDDCAARKYLYQCEHNLEQKKQGEVYFSIY